MNIAWVMGLGLASVIGLAGCASMQTEPEPPPLDGSAWVLVSLAGHGPVPGATPTARFEAGHVNGSDGCNRYSMPYKVQGSTIEIGPVGPSSQRACPEEIMAQATAYIAALKSARTFRHGDGTLELLDASNVVRVTLAAQDRALAGTSWNVTNINNGREAVVSVVSGTSVTMIFDQEGRVSGSTGCNQYTAEYSMVGDSLRLTPAAATKRACADPAVDEQEQAFLRALASIATARFEGNHLELRDETGALAMILVRDH